MSITSDMIRGHTDTIILSHLENVIVTATK